MTSFPTNRFGKAHGISAPCNTPRAKPAGVVLCSIRPDIYLIKNPTHTAAIRKFLTRRKIFPLLATGSAGLLGVSIIFPYTGSMFFPPDASRIFDPALCGIKSPMNEHPDGAKRLPLSGGEGERSV